MTDAFQQPAGCTLLVDSREPGPPHPWSTWLPEGWIVERAGLETGDMALACCPDRVIERKAASDFLNCIGGSRERFERELRRGMHCAGFLIVVESDLRTLLRNRGGLSEASLLGTLAAWTRRYGAPIFAGDQEHAARVAFRWLSQPLDEARRLIAKADRTPARTADEIRKHRPGAVKSVGTPLCASSNTQNPLREQSQTP